MALYVYLQFYIISTLFAYFVACQRLILFCFILTKGGPPICPVVIAVPVVKVWSLSR